MATYWENSCSFGLRYVSWYRCLVVGLVFSHLGFWSGGLFLIAPFPDLCLLVPFVNIQHCYRSSTCILFKDLRLIPKMMIQYIQRDLTNAYFVNISNWKAYIPNCRVYPFWNNRGKGGLLAVSVRIIEIIPKVMMQCIQRTCTNA